MKPYRVTVEFPHIDYRLHRETVEVQAKNDDDAFKKARKVVRAKSYWLRSDDSIKWLSIERVRPQSECSICGTKTSSGHCFYCNAP